MLRFIVGLGAGGMWSNGVALVTECWPVASRSFVSGVTSAGLNVGILMLSQLARIWPITSDSWKWVFNLSGAPAVLGVLVLVALPESPKWLAARGEPGRRPPRLRELFRPDLFRITLAGVVLRAIPMIGAWAASKWMIPWADKVAGSANTQYKAETQGWWVLDATLGCFAGAQLASRLGRRRSYVLISVGSAAMTFAIFQLTAPLRPSFHLVVFAQGFVAILFFGWLALYLPELFPTRVRATGVGLAYNSGRFATGVGVVLAGMLFTALGGDYARVGALCALIYGIGIPFIWWAQETANESLKA
ncbi:MFS transporter [Singulisphaera sp. GP187]|uniref:MFS transporter n=1 Tax=Singulisphaera sp. GP187 TaxID=1882752 RepID=UPI0013562B83|nr:MFS transporter [Singulisphaera sp. GP187]